MSEKPILFSGEMVRAILDGRKTQTRRLVKSNATIPGWPKVYTANRWTVSPHSGGGWMAVDVPNCENFKEFDAQGFPCPYGAVGDRLWVRETWYCDDYRVQKGPYTLPEDSARELLYYRATDDAGGGHTYTGFSGETMDNPWRPSIHMPRWASRINLEITGVRVERLSAISAADAEAEGLLNEGGEHLYHCYGRTFHPDQTCACGTRTLPEEYRALWDSLNEKRGYGWKVNPWVWVIEFKQVLT